MLLFLALWSMNYKASADAPIIRTDRIFTSPDKRFTVQLVSDDRYKFKITDNKTGKVDQSVEMITLLFSLNWTGDSKTIVTVEHIAKGSITQIIHFSNNKWSSFLVEPPDNIGHYSVLKQEIGMNTVNLTYKATKEKDNGSIIGFYTCKFDIDPATGAVTHVVTHDIDESTYASLKGLQE